MQRNLIRVFAAVVLAVMCVSSAALAEPQAQVQDPCGDSGVLVRADTQELRPTDGLSDHIDVESVTFAAPEAGVVTITQRLCGTPQVPTSGSEYVSAWTVDDCRVTLHLNDQVEAGGNTPGGARHRNLASVSSRCASGSREVPWTAVTFTNREVVVRLDATALGAGYADMLRPGTAWTSPTATDRTAASHHGGYGGLLQTAEWWDREGFDTTDPGATFVVPQPQ